MLQTSVFWLRVATALYAVGLIHAILTVLRRRADFFPLALGAFCVGVVLHFVAITELAMSIHSIPASNFFESISLCAFLIAVLFLFVYWRYQFTSLSVCIFPLVFVMTQIGSMEFPVQP